VAITSRSLVSARSTIPQCGRAEIEITRTCEGANDARDRKFPRSRNRERNREFARPASVYASRIPHGNLTINRAAVTTANKTSSALKSASIAGHRYAVYGPAEITASPHLKPKNRSAFSNAELGSSGGLRGCITVLPCIGRAWVATRRPRCNYGIEILSGERASKLESTRGAPDESPTYLKRDPGETGARIEIAPIRQLR